MMNVTPFRFPINYAAPKTMPEQATLLVERAKSAIAAMESGDDTQIIEQSLEIMQAAEGVCRMFSESAVAKVYIYVVERHAARGEYSKGLNQ